MATRDYTVACAEHGPMVRDGLGWSCPDGGCGRRIDDGQVFEQVTESPGDRSGPVALVVT
jgi:hypothetical protein